MPNVMQIKNSPNIISFGLQIELLVFAVVIITYKIFYRSYSPSKKDSIRSC